MFTIGLCWNRCAFLSVVWKSRYGRKRGSRNNRGSGEEGSGHWGARGCALRELFKGYLSDFTGHESFPTSGRPLIRLCPASSEAMSPQGWGSPSGLCPRRATFHCPSQQPRSSTGPRWVLIYRTSVPKLLVLLFLPHDHIPVMPFLPGLCWWCPLSPGSATWESFEDQRASFLSRRSSCLFPLTKPWNTSCLEKKNSAN